MGFGNRAYKGLGFRVLGSHVRNEVSSASLRVPKDKQKGVTQRIILKTYMKGGGYIEDYIGERYRAYLGDTRCLNETPIYGLLKMTGVLDSGFGV